jgi:Peptidase A4 family
MFTKRWCATALAAAGLMCAAGLTALPGVASASTGAARTASAVENTPMPGGPIVRAPGNSSIPTVSLNWSGYAATSSHKFTYAHSRFVQPAISCPGIKNQWTSNWVGLDGFTTDTVEQDGTFAHCGGPSATTPVYKAWYEMYPAGSVNVFSVAPGDVIDTSVTYAGGKFTLTVSDLTSGKTASHTAACAACQRASAEWIIERPALCNSALTKCFLTRLADFGTSTMGSNSARVAGGSTKGVGGFTNYPIYMVTPLKSGGFISLDTVGALSGRSFTATWDRTGNTVPISLGSS